MRITYGELIATREKIAKINDRAVKKGFTGLLTSEHEEISVTTKSELGFEVTEIFYDVTITGEPPKYNGWTMLAVLDWDAEAGLITRAAPGVEKVSRENLREGWCDHCKTNRDRNKTYLVGNDEGRTVQVGSTCIKDFLGWSANVTFFTDAEISDEIEEHLNQRDYSERRWSIGTVLAAAWASIQVYGFRPASSYETSTKDSVYTILNPHSKWDRAEAEKLKPYLDGSYGQAAIIREWLLSDRFTGDNEYVLNLKAVASAETASPRNVGLLASAPQTWAKAQERDLVRRKDAEETTNEWLGNEKDKVEITVTVQSIRFIDGEWGTSTLYTMKTDTGHVVKWFASSSVLGTETDGTVHRIKGSIKKLEEYKGLKSTVLTRCKKVA